mgnify:CR=1 FL=1
MMLRSLLAAALLVVAGPSLAADYRVDAIVFLNQATPNGSPDEASAAIRHFEVGGVPLAETGTLASLGITPLSGADFKLEQAWSRLRNARAFVPYLRASWTQPGQRRHQATSIRLADDVPFQIEPIPERRFLPEFYSDNPSSPQAEQPDAYGASDSAADPVYTAPDHNSASPAIDAEDGTVQPGDWALIAPEPIQLHQLDGTITLYAQRYLHLALDLWWTQHTDGSPVTAGESMPEEAARVFHIREQRRVRLNELHYFDHPRFGVLAMVTRVGD